MRHRPLACLLATLAALTAALPAPAADAKQRTWQEYAPADQASVVAGAPQDELSIAGNLERFRVSTQSGYVTIRGERGRYMVGLARDQWGIDVAHNRSTADWLWGYVAGSSTNPVSKCVFVQAAWTEPAATAATRDCSSTGDLAPERYMSSFNGNTEANCNYDTGKCDGTNVTIDGNACPAGAPVYPNVQPWLTNGARTDPPAYTIPPGATVRWRYFTLDGRHTAMRYTGTKPFAQDWGFIDKRCVSRYTTVFPVTEA